MVSGSLRCYGTIGFVGVVPGGLILNIALIANGLDRVVQWQISWLI